MARKRFLSGKLMAELREAALSHEETRATQARAARLLGCGLRTIQEREEKGAALADGYAYVGLAFRIHGAKRAEYVLEQLAQLPGVEGLKVRKALQKS